MLYRKYYSVKAFFVPMRECQMLAAIVKKRGGEHLKRLKKKKCLLWIKLHSPSTGLRKKKRIPRLKLLLRLLCINIISLCIAVGRHL